MTVFAVLTLKLQPSRTSMTNNRTMILALLFTLLLSGQTIFAAAGGAFADVPANHWAYGALTKLVRDGILQGYPDTTFQGGKIMSRYEMAVMTARAATKTKTANAEDRRLIKRLTSEFRSELDNLHARTDTLEKRVDALTVYGEAYLRFDKQYSQEKDANGVHNQTLTTANRIDIDMLWSYPINEHWQIGGESEYSRQMAYMADETSASQNDNANSIAGQLYVTGPLGGTTVKVGCYSAYSPYGLVMDDKIAGGEIAFGKVVKVTLQAGQVSHDLTWTQVSDEAGNTINNIGSQNENYAAVAVAAPLGKNSNVQAGLYRIDGRADHYQTKDDPTVSGDYLCDGNPIHYYTLAYDTKVGANWTLAAVYAKSDAKSYYSHLSNAAAWLAKIQYKEIDLETPGSCALYAMYRRSPWLAQYSDTDDWVANTQGTRIGFDYVLGKNITLLSWYTFGKTIDSGTKSNMFRTQMSFSF